MLQSGTEGGNLPLLKQSQTWTQAQGYLPVVNSVVGTYRDWQKQYWISPLVRGDHRTPNYYERSISYRKNHELQATYFLNTAYDAEGHATSWQKDIYFGGGYSNVPEGLALDGHTDRLATVRESATRNLLENLRGSLDISIDLAQLKKTAAFGRDVRKATRLSVEMFKQVGLRRITAPMRAAGNAWLLWTYGVKPTLQTIFDGLDESVNPKFLDHRRQTTVGRGNLPYFKKGSVSPNWPDWTFGNNLYILRGNYRCKITAVLNIPYHSIADAARWSSLNPMAIAWELLPWSFVVDWFFNVGEFIRAEESRMIYNRFVESVWRSTSYVITHTLEASRSGGDVPGSIWTGSYKVEGWDTYLLRERLWDIPEVGTPKLIPKLGSQRLLNAAALLTTFLRR